MNPICFDDNQEDGVKSGEGFLLTSDASSMDGIHGDPEVVPRVGDEYQAELPPFIAASHRSRLVKKTSDLEITVDMPESFSLGLPLPLMWTHCESDIDSCLGLKTQLDQPRDKYLLPELLPNRSWTDIEYNSFLLGLYTFGKNLNFLKRFVGTKSMGDILSFYYGKFFKSKGYSRWSECRKLKTRRCIFGQKIFSGWRQQELLSRLFSHVAQDCQTTLVEISRNFGEGKMHFEEYIFALKDAVGIDFLVAAVGIGKGKYDLTGTALEPTKTNHIFSVRQEMPTGKACSSLAPADIIKVLTGNFRLSKARSSDLFWEAVWPRLLANGWHSEEPKDNVVSGTKQYLVFLIPGVKKFSRRKLDKGTHYFDSISDVLNKVASDPRLLETEIQATEGSENKENKLNQDGVSNTCPSLQSHSSKCKPDLVKFTIVDTSMVHHDMDQRKVRQTRGLPFQPVSITTISSSSSSESETATSEDSEDQIVQANASSPIVDQVEQANSSYHVEDQVEQVNCSYHVGDQVEKVNSSYHVEDQVEQVNSSYHVEDQVEQVNSSYPVEDRVEQANSCDHVEEISDKRVGIDSSDRTCTPETFNTTNVDVENHKFHADLPNGEHWWDMNEPPLSEQMASDCTKCFPCTTKVQGLRACNHGEFSHSAENTFMDRMFDLNEPILPSNLHEASEGMALSFPSYQAKGSPNMSIEGGAAENQQVGEVSAKKSETRMLIDLNFPQVAPGLAIDLNLEIPFSNAIHQNDDQCTHTLSLSSETIQLNGIQEFPDGNKEQQPIIANRRQSSRSRPLTAKALEAMEYGFLNSKRKRKNTESSDNNAKSQCLRASNETVIGATCDNSIGNSLADTSAKEENVIREYSFIV